MLTHVLLQMCQLHLDRLCLGLGVQSHSIVFLRGVHRPPQKELVCLVPAPPSLSDLCRTVLHLPSGLACIPPEHGIHCAREGIMPWRCLVHSVAQRPGTPTATSLVRQYLSFVIKPLDDRTKRENKTKVREPLGGTATVAASRLLVRRLPWPWGTGPVRARVLRVFVNFVLRVLRSPNGLITNDKYCLTSGGSGRTGPVVAE